MNKFEASYASWVVRNRLLIIILCLAAVAGLASGAGKLKFDTTYRGSFWRRQSGAIGIRECRSNLCRRRQHRADSGAANLPRNELNDVFLHYFDTSIKFRTDTDFMIENLTGVDFINYSIGTGESGGISNPQFQRDIERFALWLESQPEVVHVDRFTNIMKRLNKNMHGDDESFYKLPDDPDLAAQYLLVAIDCRGHDIRYCDRRHHAFPV
ncbi:MAG: hypothetical protein O3C28_06500 [Proteobacteria bacterium]|nr:hypothetical protein [Pseudomonadota bacterium]